MTGWIIVAVLAGWAIGSVQGWVSVHNEVARECERLGSFYVGKKVYRCTAVEARND